MNLNQLHYFQVLAKYEHFSRAAQELHIAQPSLSKAIGHLEEELGVYLFEKSGRNVTLTKAGKRYLEYVETALKELALGNDRLRKEQEMSDGYIDLGFVSPIENDVLPRWIRGFQKEYQKNIFFSCQTGTSRELTAGLKEDRFDLIFCTELPGESFVEFVPVLEQALVFLAPAGHPLACRQSISVSELNGLDMVLHSHNSSMQDVTSQLFHKAGVRTRVVSEAEEDRTILALVRSGVGCGVITDSPEIHFPDVAVLPLTGTNFHRYISMGYRKDKARSPMAELFRKYVLRISAPEGNGARNHIENRP